MTLLWSLLLLLACALAAIACWPKQKLPAFLLHDHTSAVTKKDPKKAQPAALNLKNSGSIGIVGKLQAEWDAVLLILGEQAFFKLFLMGIILVAGSWLIHTQLLKFPFLLLLVLLSLITCGTGLTLLKNWRRRQFEEGFPSALKLIAGAISTGETLNNAIIYTGQTVDGLVGQTFRQMGQELAMGQPANEVFERARQRCPYPQFLFFTLALRATVHRGGQLKALLHNLNRVMSNGQTIAKKKLAMTAEARLSAKIVGAIPIIFLIIMRIFMPRDFDFICNHPSGKIILYYAIGSEILGMVIIWQLMRRVR